MSVDLAALWALVTPSFETDEAQSLANAIATVLPALPEEEFVTPTVTDADLEAVHESLLEVVEAAVANAAPAEPRTVSHAEARAILSRFNASHWNNPGEHARYSIPADPERDDDIKLARYIDECEQRDGAMLAPAWPLVDCTNDKPCSTCAVAKEEP
jgi:hypothetical protein